LRRLLAPIAIAAALLALASGAGAALVQIGNLVLTADGGFTPRKLPRGSFAPIEFEGHARLRAVDGGVPVALQRAAIDFDRDGRLTTAGLARCDPARVADATPAAARRACRRAIVGRGRVGALIARPGGPPLPVSSPLTIFNGPRRGGVPTAILHARTAVPAVQTFAIVVPIRRRGGEFRYRALVEVPPIAGGAGSLTRLEVEIGRRYRFRGKPRSYVAARCRDGILRTHGRFLFADGTIIDGSVEKGCSVAR